MKKLLYALVALTFIGCAPAVYADAQIPPNVPAAMPQELLDALKGLIAQQPLDESATQTGGVIVPPEWFKTSEDQKAWNRLGEILAKYNAFFHRTLSGVEVAGRFEKALMQIVPLSDPLGEPPVPQGPVNGFLVPDEMMQGNEDQVAWSRVGTVMHKITLVWPSLSGVLVADQLVEVLTNLTPHDQAFTDKEARQFEEVFTGFGGIGMEIKKSEDPAIPGIVGNPMPDSPSAKAGVKPGDVVVEICARPIKNDSQTNVPTTDESALESCHSTDGMPMQNAVELLRGPINTTVRVMVRRAGTPNPLPIVITRGAVHMQLVKDAQLKDGYGYVHVIAYGESTVPSVLAAVRKLETENHGPLKGFYLDERNNPGGALESVTTLLNKFLDAKRYKDVESSVTVSEEHRGEVRASSAVLDADDPGADVLHGAPLVVEVNAGSASAAEIFAGVCQIHGRCTVVGTESSFGKGTVQVMMPLQTGGKVKITVAQYLIGPRGCEKPVQDVGVIPDMFLKPDPKQSSHPEHEKDFENALTTSQHSTAACRYHYSVSPADRGAAREMLQVFGRELKDPA